MILECKQIYSEENLKHRGWTFQGLTSNSFFCTFYSPFISRSLLILPFVHQSCAFLISLAGMSSFALKFALTTPSKTYSYHNILRATSSYNFFSFSPIVLVQIDFSIWSMSASCINLKCHLIYAVPSSYLLGVLSISVIPHVAL